MPNWCYTKITVTGDETVIKKINDAFDAARTREFAKKAFRACVEADRRYSAYKDKRMSDFGTNWLGNFLHYAYRDASVWSEVDCRGRIIDTSLYGNALDIDIETAWGPQLEAIMSLIESVAGINNPNLNISFFSEEPGNAFYATNQPELIGHCFCSEYADSDIPAAELVQLINEKNGLSLRTIDEAKQYSWEHDAPWYIDGPYKERAIDNYRSYLLANEEERKKAFAKARQIIKKESAKTKKSEDKEL